PGEMLRQIPQLIRDIPANQRAQAMQEMLEQVRSVNSNWTMTSHSTSGGGTTFTGDLRGVIHVDAAGKVLYSGASHGENQAMLMALISDNVDEAIELGARVWAESGAPASVAAVTGSAGGAGAAAPAGATRPSFNFPLFEAISNPRTWLSVGAAAGSSSHTSCNPGASLCVDAQIDGPQSGGSSVYDAETNSMTIFRFQF